jgi:hypothetical protein
MFMTYREPQPGITNRVHALRPGRGYYQTWCGRPGPEQPIELEVRSGDRPCPACLEALREEVARNERALSHA